MNVDINPELAVLPTIDYRKVTPLQGNLKKLDEANYQRLKNSLTDRGLLMPICVWFNPEEDNKPYYLDGHQRHRLFTQEKVKPFEIPYIKVPGENLETAKINLLQIASQFGTTTKEGWEEFTIDMDADYLKQHSFFDNLWKEFDNPQDQFLDTGGIDAAELEKQQAHNDNVRVSDPNYATFDLPMHKDNKAKLIQLLNEIKVSKNIVKTEDALMIIINSYIETNKK